MNINQRFQIVTTPMFIINFFVCFSSLIRLVLKLIIILSLLLAIVLFNIYFIECSFFYLNPILSCNLDISIFITCKCSFILYYKTLDTRYIY